MFDFILKQEEAQKITEPFNVDIFDAINTAFQTYLQVREKFYEGSYMPIRLRSELIRTKVLQIFEKKFKNEKSKDSVRLISELEEDLVMLVIEETICLRFKKLDNKLNANFNDTKKSNEFIKQQTELQFMAKFTNLILGYVPSDTWTELKGIYVKEPQGAWAFQITEEMVSNQSKATSPQIIELPKQSILPAEPIAEPKKKEGRDKKYGTSSDQS